MLALILKKHPLIKLLHLKPPSIQASSYVKMEYPLKVYFLKVYQSNTMLIDKSENVVLDIESIIQPPDKCSGSPKVTKALSRKGSNRMERRSGEEQEGEEIPKKLVVKVVNSQIEHLKQTLVPSKTILTTPCLANSTNLADAGDGRIKRFNRLTTINPRRILLLFASIYSEVLMVKAQRGKRSPPRRLLRNRLRTREAPFASPLRLGQIVQTPRLRQRGEGPELPLKCFDKPLPREGEMGNEAGHLKQGPSSSSGSGGKAEEDASSNISDDDDPTELAECVLKEEKEPRSSSCSSMVPWLLGGRKVSILQKICLELPYYVLLLNHAPSTFSEEKNRNGRLDKLINGFIYTGNDWAMNVQAKMFILYI
ncbi:hypothetical protein HPP92_008361 [Vanilla planifolia]|uniref:Uncharacterized protein n=1 Tax=Vanilla planifolia TaxID=51239 RepID=A0A835V7U3_VANPL|nr:hypothetical protein HPP92_008361 [Vanilla planifolia]